MAGQEPRPSELNTSATLQYDAGSLTDDLGERQENWTTLGSVWCGLQPLTGQNRWLAQQVQPDVTHRVLFRYGGSTVHLLTESCRLVLGTRTIYLSPGRDLREEHRWIECDGTERVSG